MHPETDHGPSNQLAREKRLLQQLRQRPALLERLARIVELTAVEDQALLQANEVEAALVAELRALGREAMHEWAARAEERVAAEFQQAHPQARGRKKKP